MRRWGPPLFPIGNKECGGGLILRSLAFSGLPILEPSLVGARFLIFRSEKYSIRLSWFVELFGSFELIISVPITFNAKECKSDVANFSICKTSEWTVWKTPKHSNIDLAESGTFRISFSNEEDCNIFLSSNISESSKSFQKNVYVGCNAAPDFWLIESASSKDILFGLTSDEFASNCHHSWHQAPGFKLWLFSKNSPGEIRISPKSIIFFILGR